MNLCQLFSLLLVVHCGSSMPSRSNYVLTMDKIENKNNATQAKSYVVNLDQAPMHRWQALVHQVNVSYFVQAVHAMLKPVFKSPKMVAIAERIAGDLDRYIAQPYSDEMRGLSAATGIPLGDIILTNILYDFTAYANSSIKACTSIVAIDKSGRIIHGRNFDYLPEYLKNLTIQVEFQRNGKAVYTASSYIGYIGILTGSRHGAFSLSGDQRNYGTLWKNIITSLEGGHITFFAARKVLDESSDYKSALNQLINTPTDAPVYFILGSIRPSEGALVVRNGEDVALVKHMDNSFTHPWFLVETNYDPWKDPPKSDNNRRQAAIDSMTAVGKDKMDTDQLYKVLSTPPVLNEQTTFTTIMSASDAGAYKTMVRFDGPTE